MDTNALTAKCNNDRLMKDENEHWGVEKKKCKRIENVW